MVERFCLARVDHVLVVIDEAAESLTALGRSRETTHVVSNTPSRALASRYADVRRPARDVVELAYLGVMEIQRGVSEVVEAVGLLRAEGVRVRLRLLGGGRDLPVFQEKARALGLGPDAVEFTGFIQSHDEAMRELAGADIGVCPQRAGVMSDWIIPNKLFDYMALGLPVLSADSRPCRRVVEATGAGVVYRSMDATDAARAIRELLAPDVRARAGSAGREAILSGMNWETDSLALLRAVEAATAATRTSRSA
jgi:glycosyltransferase involved in cell wall biosynthesis